MDHQKEDWEREWAKKAIKEKKSVHFADLARLLGELKARRKERKTQTAKERKMELHEFCSVVGESLRSRFEDLKKKKFAVMGEYKAFGGQSDALVKRDRKKYPNSVEKFNEEQFRVKGRVEIHAYGGEDEVWLFSPEKKNSIDSWLWRWGDREALKERVIRRGLDWSAKMEGILAKERKSELSEPLRVIGAEEDISSSVKSPKTQAPVARRV